MILLLRFNSQLQMTASKDNGGKTKAKYCSKIFYFVYPLKYSARNSLCFQNNKDYLEGEG